VWHALLRTLEPDLAVVPSEGDDVSLPEDWGRSGAPRIRLQVTGLDGAVTVTEEVGAEFFHGRVILE
jgi:hypothetical protein